MQGELVMVVDRRHLACHPVLSKGLMSILVTSSRLLLRANDPRQSMKEATVSFITRASESTPIMLQFSFGYTGQPYLVWERVPKGIKTKREGIMGVILGASCHC